MITCPEEGCDFNADRAQVIGRHRQLKHGYVSPKSSSPTPKAKAQTIAKTRDEIITVLDVLCPKGIKVQHLNVVNDWIDSTRRMLDLVRGG